MVILSGPGVAGDPASAGIFGFRLFVDRVGMGGVVIDGADDYAARPGGDSGQRGALEFSGVVARFQIFHFALLAVGDPFGKNAELREVADGGDTAEIESYLAGESFDTG